MMDPLSSDLKQRILESEVKNWLNVYPAEELYKDPEVKLKTRVEEFNLILKTLSAKLELSGKSILDFGCGFGYFSMASEEPGTAITGIDPDQDQVKIAQQILKNRKGRSFICAAGEALPFKDNSFDRILSFSVLEHVCDLDRVLQEAHRVLKPNGLFYIGVPNYLTFREGHYKIFYLPMMNRLLAKWYLRLLGKNPDFLESIRYLTPLNLRAQLLKSRFYIIEDAVNNGIKRFNNKIDDPSSAGLKGKIARIIRWVHLEWLARFLINRGFFIMNSFIVTKKPEHSTKKDS